MGMNKNLENDIKKEGFIKRNTKKGGNYVKNEATTFTNFKQIILYKEYIVNMITFLNPFNKEKRESKVETFSNAVRRLNINEKDLNDSFKYYLLTFWLGAFLFISSLLFGGYVLFFKSNIWAIGPTIACIAIGSAQIITGSFRSYQINQRELCSISSWINSKKFIPVNFKNNEEVNKEKRRESKKSLQKINSK